MKIKACLFDLDGTVLDTVHTITHYVNAALDEEGIPPIDEPMCKQFTGNGARRLITRTLAARAIRDPQSIERVLARYDRLYNADPLYLTRPFDGILPLLQELRARDIRVGILSNKPEYATCALSAHFFGALCDLTHGGRDGVPLKPDPTACLDMLATLGASADETVYVGDSDVDMQTGRALGARLTIGVLWGFRGEAELSANGADLLVSDPCQILRAIDDVRFDR